MYTSRFFLVLPHFILWSPFSLWENSGSQQLQYVYSFAPNYTAVTESGVQLLASQKPVKRQVGGKESLLYFGCWQPVGRADSYPKADSPHWQSVGKSFYRQRVGATCRNSTVSSDSHLEIGHVVVWPASSWLSTVNLQFQGRFVFISRNCGSLYHGYSFITM